MPFIKWRALSRKHGLESKHVPPNFGWLQTCAYRAAVRWIYQMFFPYRQLFKNDICKASILITHTLNQIIQKTKNEKLASILLQPGSEKHSQWGGPWKTNTTLFPPSQKLHPKSCSPPGKYNRHARMFSNLFRVVAKASSTCGRLAAMRPLHLKFLPEDIAAKNAARATTTSGLAERGKIWTQSLKVTNSQYMLSGK